MTLLANGINAEGWNAEDVKDACAFLEATGRTVKRDEWVEEYVQAKAKNSFRSHG